MAQGTGGDGGFGGGHRGGRAIVEGRSHDCGFKRKHDRGGLDRGKCGPARGYGGLASHNPPQRITTIPVGIATSDKISVDLHQDNCQDVQQGRTPKRDDDCSSDCGADSGNYKGLGHDILQGDYGTTTRGGNSEDITPTHSSALDPTTEDKFEKVESRKKRDFNRVTRVARINGHNKSSVSQGWWMSVLICLHITLTGAKGTSTDSATTFWDDVQVSNMTNTSSLEARQVKGPLSGQSTIWLCSAAVAVLIILALFCFFVVNLNKQTKAKETKRKRTKPPKTAPTTQQETTTTTRTRTTKKAPKTGNNSTSRTPPQTKSTPSVPRSPKCLDLTAKTDNTQYTELKKNLEEIKKFLDSDIVLPEKLEIKRAFVKLQRTITILNQLKNLASFVAPQQYQQTETQVREIKRTFTARVKEMKEKVKSSESEQPPQDTVDHNDERKGREDPKAEQITDSPSLEISDNFSDTVTAAWLERFQSSLEEL